MADLDDFFKKRDKKKKTVTKSKFSVLDTDDIAKQLETITINAERDENLDGDANANENNESTTFNQQVSNENVDEEWKPFDSDENKDYTGLRINIQNWKVEDEENNFEEANEENDKKAACPWGAANLKFKKPEESESADKEEESKPVPQAASEDNTSKATEEPAAQSSEPEPSAPSTGAYMTPAQRRMLAEKAGNAGASTGSSAPAPAPATAAAPSAYVPPHLRNAASSSNGPTTVVRKSNKAQPNIMDTMEFPTLDAVATEEAAPALTNGNSDRFEMAKKGGRVEQKTNKGNSIDLDNKFTALSASNQ